MSVSTAQTILWQSGFETGDPSFIYDGVQVPFNSTSSPYAGTNHGQINGGCSGGTAGCYDGSIITPLLTFYPGCNYSVKVYAKRVTGAGNMTIAKAITATNTAIKGATGSDVIMASTAVSTAYTLYSGTFSVTTTESKYIGFQMFFAGGGGQSGSQMQIDNVVITKECPSCFNGIQDGDETGIDCGGTLCAGAAPVGGTVSPPTQTLSCGLGNFTLTLAGHTGNPQWQASRDGGSIWYDLPSETGTTFTGSVRNTTLFRVNVSNDGCTPTPAYSSIATVTITGVGNKTWLTSGTSDWGNGANWNPSGFPGACDNVTIPAGGIQPVITANAGCNNIFINASATLTINGGGTQFFTVYGDFINNGTLNDASSTQPTLLAGRSPCFFGGSGTFWDGSNYVGKFTIAANAAYTLTSNINPLYGFEIQSNGSLSLSYYKMIVTNTWNQIGYFFGNAGILEARGSAGTITSSTSTWGKGTLHMNFNPPVPSQTFFTPDDYYNIIFENLGNSVSIDVTPFDVTNDFTIKPSTTVTFGTNGTVLNIGGTLGGDFTNDGTFTPAGSFVVLKGLSEQEIKGTSSTVFDNLTINNASSTGVIVAKECTVNTTLTLTDAILNTDQYGKYIYLSSTASVSPAGGSSASYIDGFIQKAGNTAFIFPTGDGTKWRRIAIGAPSISSTYRAKYWNSGFSNYTITPPLTDVSQIEYWILDRMIGTGNTTVAFNWEDASASGIDDCPDLTIAKWNGTSWVEQSATATGSCTGTGTGSVVTNSAVLSFSPFTFGSKSLAVNPLGMILGCFATISSTFTNVTCPNAGDGTIDITVTGATPPKTYLWNDGAITEDRTALAAGTFTVTITDAEPCTYTETVTITQPADTVVTGTIAPTTYCAGNSVSVPYTLFCNVNAGNVFTAQLSDAAGSFAAPTNIGIISSTTSGTIAATIPVAQPSGSGYRIRVVSSDPITTGSDNGTDLTVNSNPTPTITAGGPTTFCAGGSVTLTSSAASSYSWSTTETTASINVTASGNYTVTVTDGNGCTGASAPTTVTVNSNPTPTITAGGPTTFCAGGSVTLTSSAASSYSWSTTETTASINVTASGNYREWLYGSISANNGNRQFQSYANDYRGRSDNILCGGECNADFKYSKFLFMEYDRNNRKHQCNCRRKLYCHCYRRQRLHRNGKSGNNR
ncbi:MAG: SprB repeat-containing protein [Bacteroidetes bacterium]|nr:SprB repeat-containing protein [Bacteroidota bacterium]